MGQQPKRYFPAFVDLDGAPVVVIGDTPSSERRIRALRRYGADVTVVTESTTEWLRAQEADGELSIEQRAFRSGDLQGAMLAFCHVADEGVRESVKKEAVRLGCLLNVSDDHGRSNMLLPGVVNRPPLQIAVSTSGMAPELAQRVRKDVADTYAPHWGEYVLLLGELRARVYAHTESTEQRARLMGMLIDSDIEQRLADGQALSVDAEWAALEASFAEDGAPEAEGDE